MVLFSLIPLFRKSCPIRNYTFIAVITCVLCAVLTPSLTFAASGKTLYKKRCVSCHSLEAGVNGIGPSLYDIIGKAAGSEKGFGGYGGLKGARFVWTAEFLDSFIYDPKYFLGKLTPMMSRVKKAKERIAIIEFLKAQQ
ncbi:MAG: cytochrome C [Rhodospirillaceae bacterium]|nr:MAG: cytochrome C [Rhodospirillaceae bacterium]